ncbi:MAG: two-component sensor kinase [Candidatus Scalindua rubra]|uniref:histidine kinase n=1 Tax=Candidatus Scalindua rubra TaxID=1872076 RepID=A0A1E3X4K3_9BACT|nr:MAG: two-component sensor kinase [Candidatus Scalindua rubra]
MAKGKLIGNILLEKNLVNEDQINEALKVQKTSGKPLGNILVELGYITSSLITEALNIAQKREEQLAQLLNVSSDMVKEMELTSLLKYTMDEAVRILDADRCTLYLVDENANELRSFIAQRAEIQEIRMPLGKGVAGYVAKTGEMVNLENAYKSPLFDPKTDEETGYKTRTILCIPLKSKNDKIIGALQALNKKGGGTFSFNDEWLFKSYGSCAANAISTVLSDEEVSSDTKAAENMERLSLTVENIPDGVIMISKEEDSVVVNPAARWMLGFEINKTLDKKDTLERFREIGLVNVLKWLESDIEDIFPQEVIIREPETRVIMIDFADIGRHAKGENKKGFVAVLKDITKEKEIERIKSEFIAIASHEFISPITSIKNATSLLVQGTLGPNTDSQKKFLKMIEDSTEYLAYLTTTLLDLSLIESNRMHIKLDKVNLSQIVKSVVENTQYMAKEKEISLIVKDDNPPPVLADPYRTRQSMLALLDNAYKFTPNGGEIVVNIKLTEKKMGTDIKDNDSDAEVNTKHPEKEVEFSVKDNGLGISLEEQEKIFEKFYQIESAITRENYGMGLGLSICKDIVEAQGGRLWVESKKGEGSRFAFTLPVYE